MCVCVMQVLVDARNMPREVLAALTPEKRVTYPACVWRVFDALACAACVGQTQQPGAALAALGHHEVCTQRARSFALRVQIGWARQIVAAEEASE